MDANKKKVPTIPIPKIKKLEYARQKEGVAIVTKDSVCVECGTTPEKMIVHMGCMHYECSFCYTAKCFQCRRNKNIEVITID